MNLVPNSTFTIVRQISNVNDTATYYIQAVIRNINTGATLATVNLLPVGKQRYTGKYQVPADVSGQGTYISITTYVYDDAGYSTPDQNYDTEDAEYLIIQPPVSSFGNGGTVLIDYDRIGALIDGIKFPGTPSFDIPDYFASFRDLRAAHEERFSAIEKKIGDIRFPVPERYNDSEVRGLINGLRAEIGYMDNEYKTRHKEMAEKYSKDLKEIRSFMVDSLRAIGSEIKAVFDEQKKGEEEARDKNRKTLLSILSGTETRLPTEKKEDLRAKRLLGLA